MTTGASRKRAAPGASPVQNVGSSTFTAQPSYSTADQYLQWDQGNTIMGSTGYGDAESTFAPNLYATIANQAIPQETSNQLTRRPINTMSPKPSYGNGTNDAWPDLVDDLTQPNNFNWIQSTDEERIDEEAREAMEAAKKNRKQIPPFVQKLRSFLDEFRNTELIRWSPEGDSFIVLDEEEFARTLIPELFKHANYASFVRQLNMYGFHKQVGLSDNSMRASERKNKSPSEYKNPYFKRGKPSWMWLIQKPKSVQGKGKGGKERQEEGNEEEENYEVENPAVAGANGKDRGSSIRAAKPPLMIGQGDNALAHEELTTLHQELRLIRQQHQAIAGVIQKIRCDHDQIIQQAQAFQDLHNRHENSINAILTFLATVYNRSLEGHGNQNIGNMFASNVPHDLPQQGSVVDVGDLGDQGVNPKGTPARRHPRRQPLLLQAPPSSSGVEDGRITSVASTPQASNDTSNRDPFAIMQDQNQASNHPVVEELSDQEPRRPIRTAQQPTMNNDTGAGCAMSERDIMSLINSANANDVNMPATSQMDFGEALSHLQNSDGKGPLSASERNGMLKLMANGSNQGLSEMDNNALTSPNPPTAHVSNLQNWQASDDDIAFLQKSMRDTDSKLTNISNRLSPISPNGSIPGFNDVNSYIPVQLNDSLDFDQIFNSGDYFNDVNNDAEFGDDSTGFDGNNDFSFDNPLGDSAAPGYARDTGETPEGRVVETLNSSEATSPANTTEEGGQVEEESRPMKRQRS